MPVNETVHCMPVRKALHDSPGVLLQLGGVAQYRPGEGSALVLECQSPKLAYIPPSYIQHSLRQRFKVKHCGHVCWPCPLYLGGTRRRHGTAPPAPSSSIYGRCK